MAKFGAWQKSFATLLFSLLFSMWLAHDGARAEAPFAAIAVDAQTGRILFSRDADAQRYPASLTKIMTLYVLFEELEAGRMALDTPLTVSQHAASMQPSKLGLAAGTTISVENAIKALVTKSANDIAVAVAEGVSGTESAFAQRMTQTARSIGMTRSRFRNANGLPNGQQVTTARDMATLGLRIQVDFPQYYHYFSLRSFTYRGRTYRNHNRLLGAYDGADGIKTGYTRASGYNLTASVRRQGRHVIGVVMGGRTGASRNEYMKSMLTRALDRVQPSDSVNVALLAGVPPDMTPGIRDDYPLPEPKPGTGAAAAVASLTTGPAEVMPAPDTTIVFTPDTASVASLGDTTPTRPVVLEPISDEGSIAEEQEPQETAPVPSGWAIQIGAYSSESDAHQRLATAQELGLALLDGKSPFTVQHSTDDNKVIYRARFGGFDRASARNACQQLIRRSINCFPLAPQG
jgi:D-alanyl-D-alanine carboxypeptidase